jgi:hypothetical protein
MGLTILSERGKSAPARKVREDNVEIKKALADNDFTAVSVLLKRKLGRVLAAKGRGPK